MADVRLLQTEDGGEVELVGGQITLDEGLDSAVFLSLFGGNDDDSGLDGDKPRQWWGNVDELDEARKYRSLTQYLLRSLPLIPNNLRRIEDAAVSDLAWMIESKLASFVGATATMPGRNTIKLALKIEIQSKPFEPSFLFRKSQQ
jgi:phage gp46-like protein